MQGLTEGLTALDYVLRVIAVLGIVGGFATLLAYFIFTTLSTKWLDTKFQERLERFRHAHQRELEELRLRINTLFDRTTRLHQREFEVTPEAWAKLNDAFWTTKSLVSPFQQYPDLARMSDEHFSEFVDSCQLGNWEKNELKGLPVHDRNRYYIDHVYWPRLGETREKVRDMYVYLMKNGIFLRPDIKEKFMNLSDMIGKALHEDEFHQQNRDVRPQTREKRDVLGKEGEGLLKELEGHVYQRLWSSQDAKEIL